jgi:hypothetical protein
MGSALESVESDLVRLDELREGFARKKCQVPCFKFQVSGTDLDL